MTITSTALDWIKSFIIAIILALLIKTFIFNTTLVIGDSMFPTLHERDRLVINKISIMVSGYDRGDIVVLKAPDEEHKNYIKRIIGIAGDTVELINGEVYLNGKILIENYIEEDFTHSYDEDYWEVQEGEVFILGDNRQEWASKDSRFFGCVPVKLLKGKTNFRYFPFNSITKLD